MAIDPLIQLRFLEEAIVACRGQAGRRVYLRDSKATRRRVTPTDATEGEERDLGECGVDRTRGARGG